MLLCLMEAGPGQIIALVGNEGDQLRTPAARFDQGQGRQPLAWLSTRLPVESVLQGNLASAHPETLSFWNR